METKSKNYCGVPQCSNFKNKFISLHKLPKNVLKIKKLKKQWMHILKMGKDFPKNFRICSEHFQGKYLLKRIQPTGLQERVFLSNGAIPTEKLPKFLIEHPPKKLRRSLIRKKPPNAITDNIEKENVESENEVFNQKNSLVEPENEVFGKKIVQFSLISSSTVDSKIQVNFGCKSLLVTTLFDTEKKLKTMTGLPLFTLLDALVEILDNIHEKEMVKWSKQMVMQLIPAYKERECLWNAKSKSYKNSYLRSKAIEEISKMFGMSAERIKKKINVLRTYFIEELKKIEISKRNGDELYIPNIYWFEELLFLKNIVNNNKKKRLGKSNNNKDELVNINHSKNDKFDLALKTINVAVDNTKKSEEKRSTTADDEVSAFCHSMEMLLKSLPPVKRLKAMNVISNILMKIRIQDAEEKKMCTL